MSIGDKLKSSYRDIHKELWLIGIDKTVTKIFPVSGQPEPFGAIYGNIIKRIDTKIITEIDPYFCLEYFSPKGMFKPHYHNSMEMGTLLEGKARYRTELDLGKWIHLDASSARNNQWSIDSMIWHEFEFTSDCVSFC